GLTGLAPATSCYGPNVSSLTIDAGNGNDTLAVASTSPSTPGIFDREGTTGWGEGAGRATPPPEEVRCRYCLSRDVEPSRPRPLHWLRSLLGLRRYRCHLCGRRFHRF